MLPAVSLALLSYFWTTTLAADNGLAVTPQMGWNTWNHFGCNINEDTILDAANAVIANNLTQFGYECESVALYPGQSTDLYALLDILMDDCK